ncbi:MAG: EAL domain-containing protein [Burkholderiales bacterium]
MSPSCQAAPNINCLKIDKFFIDKLLTLNPDEAMTGDIMSMAHRLGHCVVAEGVEYESQRQYLQEHSCDKIQGYLIWKPLDEEAVFKLLTETNPDKNA